MSADKNNYMALVLIAVAAEGLEEYDQALKAYKRAIEADDSQALAWQVRFIVYSYTSISHGPFNEGDWGWSGGAMMLPGILLIWKKVGQVGLRTDTCFLLKTGY